MNIMYLLKDFKISFWSQLAFKLKTVSHYVEYYVTDSNSQGSKK